MPHDTDHHYLSFNSDKHTHIVAFALSFFHGLLLTSKRFTLSFNTFKQRFFAVFTTNQIRVYCPLVGGELTSEGFGEYRLSKVVHPCLGGIDPRFNFISKSE
ncbi:TPA: hypothetical protein ACF373_002145 [Vibrio parahaemolyticus]